VYLAADMDNVKVGIPSYADHADAEYCKDELRDRKFAEANPHLQGYAEMASLTSFVTECEQDADADTPPALYAAEKQFVEGLFLPAKTADSLTYSDMKTGETFEVSKTAMAKSAPRQAARIEAVETVTAAWIGAKGLNFENPAPIVDDITTAVQHTTLNRKRLEFLSMQADFLFWTAGCSGAPEASIDTSMTARLARQSSALERGESPSILDVMTRVPDEANLAFIKKYNVSAPMVLFIMNHHFRAQQQVARFQLDTLDYVSKNSESALKTLSKATDAFELEEAPLKASRFARFLALFPEEGNGVELLPKRPAGLLSVDEHTSRIGAFIFEASELLGVHPRGTWLGEQISYDLANNAVIVQGKSYDLSSKTYPGTEKSGLDIIPDFDMPLIEDVLGKWSSGKGIDLATTEFKWPKLNGSPLYYAWDSNADSVARVMAPFVRNNYTTDVAVDEQ
jgi:hypothetical protein